MVSNLKPDYLNHFVNTGNLTFTIFFQYQNTTIDVLPVAAPHTKVSR